MYYNYIAFDICIYFKPICIGKLCSFMKRDISHEFSFTLLVVTQIEKLYKNNKIRL